MQSVGALGLPKVSIGEFPFMTDYEDRVMQLYFPVLEKTQAGKEVLEELGKDPRVSALSDKMIPSGMGRTRFQIKLLALWYLRYANEHGHEEARKCLESFLNAESVPVTRVLWVIGMGASNSVTIKGHYVIRPIHEMPDSSQKERFLQNARHFSPAKAPAAECAITKDIQAKKATIPDERPEQDEAQNVREADLRMEEIAWLLNALDGVCCVPFITSGHVESNIPFGPFGGWGASGRVLDAPGMARTRLPDGSAETINELLDDYDRLDEQERTRIQRILSRLSLAKRSLLIEDKILDLGIAMEMLLLQDNANREQLALAFRLRGSWLLGSSPAERRTVYEQLKELYRYRSEVAHSGVLRKGNPAEMNKIGAQFPVYQSLAERTIRRIMKLGTPDWESLTIGAS